MGKTVEVRMTIPLDDDEKRNAYPIFFYEWLPETVSEALALVEDGMMCLYWADQECIQQVTRSRKVDGKRQNMEMWVGKLYASVGGFSVEDRLAETIVQLSKETLFDPDHFAKKYDAALLLQHQELTRRIHRNALFGLNRVIGHIRAERGQYWLEERKVEGRDIFSDFNKFRAKVSIEGSESMRLVDTRIGVWRAFPCPVDRRVGREDWKAVGSLMRSKPDLMGTLLTAADEYRSIDQTRIAMIEAVSALEIAVGEFAEKNNASDWFKAGSLERFGIESLKAHCNHLGFTATVSYLFPMIFTEEQVSATTLRDCRDAINERHTIIHKRQRSVKPEKLERFLESIRRLCGFLRSLCPDDHRGDSC